MIDKKLEKKFGVLFPESSAHLNGAGDVKSVYFVITKMFPNIFGH